jgi:hypothetical protein
MKRCTFEVDVISKMKQAVKFLEKRQLFQGGINGDKKEKNLAGKISR